MSYKVSTNSNSPLVSVLIPLYNAEKYIEETLQSVIDQTYKNFEIIIVDDGSTDQSYLIAKKYASNNIMVTRQKNSGPGAARNKAFKLSSGEFIQYLDADDILHPEKIDKQMSYLINSASNTLIRGKCGRFNKNVSNATFAERKVDRNFKNPIDLLVTMWSNGEAIFLHEWLVPRRLIELSGGWNEELSNNDDGEFFARVISLFEEVIYEKESIVYYRTDSQNSVSKGRSEKSERSNLKSLDLYFELMQNNLNEPKVRYALATVYSSFIYYTYPRFDNLRKHAVAKIKMLGYESPFFKKGRKIYYLSRIFGFDNALRINYFFVKIQKIMNNIMRKKYDD